MSNQVIIDKFENIVTALYFVIEKNRIVKESPTRQIENIAGSV
jgi:hypothetical protein